MVRGRSSVAEVYACRGCNAPPRPARWTGPCPNCGGRWSIITRRISADEHLSAVADGEVVSLCDVDATEEPRIELGGNLSSVDDMLGGGIVDGKAVYLLTGDPGIGKTSLLLMVLQRLAEKGLSVLYASGEESLRQIAARSRRFGAFHPRLQAVRDCDLDNILDLAIASEVNVLVIDSLHTLVVTSPATGDPFETGSAASIATAMRLLEAFATEQEIPVWTIGHVTKDGAISGPKTLEHLCDVAMHFEGTKGEEARVLRIDTKNRFGAANRRAKFAMGENGLVAVDDQEGRDLRGDFVPKKAKQRKRRVRA